MEGTALVTGAARGIGAETARELHKRGWRVIINYRTSGEAARELARELDAVAIRADISDFTEARKLFSEAGGVDLLICNAGEACYGLLSDIEPEELSRTFAVNAVGPANCARLAIPHMVGQKRGSIIMVSSVWGIRGASCEAAYSAAKASLTGLTLSLAKELGPSGIRVNCVAPGVIRTDMLSGFSEKDMRALAEDTPLGRLGSPGDVARLIGFLASGEASFITGQIIGVDGGFGL